LNVVFRILGLLFFTLPVFAGVTIDISQGQDKPIPVAVSQFALSNTIKTDLQNSGRFVVVKPKNTSQAQYDVTGSRQGNVVRCNLSLATTHRVLFSKSFTLTKTTSVKHVGHQASNDIYRVITGKRGYFNTYIAYVTDVHKAHGSDLYGLYVAAYDGANPQLLLAQYNAPIGSLSWSPDGHHIVYVSYNGGAMQIDEVSLLTGKRSQIASFPGMNSAPAFSPSGKFLAMALAGANETNTNIYLMNIKTRHMTQLTHVGNNTSPSFSPDGSHIVFTSGRGGNPQIYQMTQRGSGIARLTYNGVQNFRAEYTPSGNAIVMMHEAAAGGTIQIAKMDLTTGNIAPVSTGSLDKSPSIAPNGQMVLYNAYNGLNGALAESSIDGKIQMKLPKVRGRVTSPAWSPYLQNI
jgi:TolB protein